MSEPENEMRRTWMSLLARAPSGKLAELMEAGSFEKPFEWLRQPEIGSVMVRGRIGGTGAPFNMGEMTVTRCALKLADGTVGHGYVQGRSKAASQAAALVDAMMQTSEADAVRSAVLDPLQVERDEKRAKRAAKAAATKVDFFTMARGED